MHQIIFYFIIGILIFDYVLDQFLDYLNSTKRSSKLPSVLNGIYDEEKYKKSQDYDKVNHKFSILTSSFNLLLILVFLYFSGFAIIDNLARSFSANIILISLIFFGIIMLASDILNTPFNIYDTFVIEEKFGFNKTTVKTFILDKVKGWFIAAIIGGGLLALIIWFYNTVGEYFWIYAWIVVSTFMLFMTMFYTSLIVPLFNKLKPLEDGDLKDEITSFCNGVGFKLDNVFVIDGSKRSTKANAYFSGLGKRKKIVLFDTLIEKLSKEEIVAVLAHEIGHYKKKHTLISVFSSIIQTGLTLFILSLFVGNPELSKALGSDIPSFHLGLITFGFLYSPISTIIGLFMNVISRKNEYVADQYAAENYKGVHLQNALKTLSVTNLSNLTPHPVFVFFNYSHPTLLQRLKFIGKFNS
ncbi:MAG: M48 family metallopeptidase [Bacteroidales bacterium]|jgi:STE24 endopeptidase|nr:M48 family metallopeptidase [Bacteroidales bacterium]